MMPQMMMMPGLTTGGLTGLTGMAGVGTDPMAVGEAQPRGKDRLAESCWTVLKTPCFRAFRCLPMHFQKKGRQSWCSGTTAGSLENCSGDTNGGATIKDLLSISLQELDFPSFSKKSMTSIDFRCRVKLQGWNLLTVATCYSPANRHISYFTDIEYICAVSVYIPINRWYVYAQYRYDREPADPYKQGDHSPPQISIYKPLEVSGSIFDHTVYGIRFIKKNCTQVVMFRIVLSAEHEHMSDAEMSLIWDNGNRCTDTVLKGWTNKT